MHQNINEKSKHLCIRYNQNSNILDEQWIEEFYLKDKFTRDDNFRFTKRFFALKYPTKDELKDFDIYNQNIISFHELEDLIQVRKAIINQKDREFSVFKIKF